VIYPGLPSHPRHNLVGRQMANGGGMIAAYLAADEERTIEVLKRFRIFALAESLGAVESLVGQPWVMSHGSVAEETRRARGITPNLIRLSIGLEDAEDLIEDIDHALAVLR
jgi:cystathionine gamma-lyase